MSNFSIELSKDNVEFEGDIVAFGTLTIGDFVENFQASLSYWDRTDYLSQWYESLERLFNGENKAAIVTTMYNPKTVNFIFWWIMYLIEDNVHIQHHLLLLDILDQPFHKDELYKFIPSRETYTEEGELISEWVVPLSCIEKFLNSHI